MVRLFNQVFRQVVGFERRQTTAKGKGQARAPVDGNFNLIELISNAVKKHSRVFGCSVRKNDGELISTNAANDILLSQVYPDKLREELQNLITSAMSDLLVYFFE